LITLVMCGMSFAVVRATNVAPAPSASESGFEGPVHRPEGELLVLLAQLAGGRCLSLVNP